MDRPELVVHGGLLSEQRLKLQCVCVGGGGGGDGGMSERERENVCIWGVSECETWYMPCVIDRDRRKGWGEGEERGREREVSPYPWPTGWCVRWWQERT